MKVRPHHFMLATAVLLLTLIAFPFLNHPAHAQGNASLTLDHEFAGQGVADQPALNVVRDFIRLSDGSFIAAGEDGYNYFDTTLRLTKFTPQGMPDTTFGTQGVIEVTDVYTGVHVSSLESDSQERIIVLADNHSGGIRTFTLLRFLPTGQLDSTFGDAGRVVFEVGHDYVTAFEIATLSDNSIVVWVNGGNGDYRYRLYRFTEAGDLDTDFGEGGIVFASAQDNWKRLRIDANDNILLVGTYYIPEESTEMAVWRFTPTGERDSTFGDDGAILSIFDVYSIAYDIQQSTDGTYLVVGTREGANNLYGVTAVRLTPTGEFDSTFDNDGRWVYEFGPDYEDGAAATLVGVNPNGTITLVTSHRGKLRLIQLLENGAWNLAFGVAGITEPLWSDFQLNHDALFHQDRGEFGMDAEGNLYIGGIMNHAAIQKFTAAGVPDWAFGRQGWAVFGSVRGVETMASLQQPDGKTVMVMNTVNFGGAYATRVLADGTPDLSFGRDGITRLPYTHAGGFIATAYVQMDAEGRLLVMIDDTLMRLLPDGTVDTAFGINGVWEAPTQAQAQMVVQSTNQPVVALGTNPQNPNGSTLIRLLENGALDNTFGTGGMLHIEDCLWQGEQGTLGVQPDDKLLYLGKSCDFPNETMPLHRFTADGTVDSPFGTEGISELPTLSNPALWYESHLLITGNRINNNVLHPSVMRVTADGDADSSFGVGGVQSVAFPLNPYAVQVNTLVTDPQTGILLLGTWQEDFLTAPQTFAIRLLSNGVTDTDFGTDGIQSLVLPYGVDQMVGAAVQAERVVITYTQSVTRPPYDSYDRAMFIAGLRLEGDSVPPSPTPSPTATPPMPTATATPSPTATTPVPTATATPTGTRSMVFLPLTQR